jgi:hypothetical protein
MLSNFFKSQWLKKLHNDSTGSLFESFARLLSEAAYANRTARRHLRAAEHFLYRIHRHGSTVHDANEQALKRFANHFSQCQCPHFSHADPVGVTGGARLFASHLREIGIIASPVRQESKNPELLIAFGHWMRQQRGTCDVTLSVYSQPLRELLERIGGNQADSRRACYEILFWKSIARADGSRLNSALRHSACSCAS